MAIGLALVIGIVVLLGLVVVFAGGRTGGILLGLVALIVLGGAGLFFFGARTTVVTVPAAAPAIPVATVAAVPVAPEAPPSRSLHGRVLKGAEGEVPFEAAVVQGPAGFAATTGADGRFVLEGLPLADLRLRAVAPGFAGASVKVPLDGGREDVTLRLVPGAWAAGRILDREARTPI